MGSVAVMSVELRWHCRPAPASAPEDAFPVRTPCAHGLGWMLTTNVWRADIPGYFGPTPDQIFHKIYEDNHKKNAHSVYGPRRIPSLR